MLTTIFISALVGGLIVALLLIPRLQKRVKEDKQIAEQNNQLNQQNKELIANYQELQKETDKLNFDIKQQHQVIDSLNQKKEDIVAHANELNDITKKNAEAYFNSQVELVETNLAAQIDKAAEEFSQAKTEYCDSYLDLMDDYVKDFISETSQMETEKEELAVQLKELKAKVDAATASAKREQEKKDQINFYKLVLPEIDIEEIKVLRSIENRLRNKEPLNKVIWKCYYEKPTTDLIGRVIGSGTHIGIYKITNLENQMSYVGRSNDLGERWKQHIKRGIGADPPTRNKLYPAMLETGVENFSFEVIEECKAEELDSREKFWQNYYNSQSFGYSIR